MTKYKYVEEEAEEGEEEEDWGQWGSKRQFGTTGFWQ